ncbi:MAG: hypothetical protein B6245_18280 [Desulfobacteraceae bacterium 4572_88]|nr:MAG: hypothetical protein B6245_18280 [Desulfobacteraceae bacterium 4572_88]
MERLNPKTREYIADASIFLISIIWGSTYIVVKQVIEDIPVFAFLTLRFGLAAIFLLFISHKKLAQIRLKGLANGILLGTVLFLTFAFQTLGLKYTAASVTAFITGLYVVFVPIFSSVLLKKRPHICSLTGVFLSGVGLAFITLNGKMGLSMGEALVFMCSIFCSLHIILTDAYSRKNDVLLLTTIQICVIFLLSCLTSLVYEPFTLPETWNSQLIFAVFLMGIFATVLTFLVQTGMQKHTTPTKAAIIFSMEPVSSVFFGYAIAGEVLTSQQYLGAALIIAAMLVSEIGTYIRISAEAWVRTVFARKIKTPSEP